MAKSWKIFITRCYVAVHTLTVEGWSHGSAGESMLHPGKAPEVLRQLTAPATPAPALAPFSVLGRHDSPMHKPLRHIYIYHLKIFAYAQYVLPKIMMA